MIINQSSLQQALHTSNFYEVNSVTAITTLQLELAILKAKITNYYYEEVTLRGDKNLMREYRSYFNI